MGENNPRHRKFHDVVLIGLILALIGIVVLMPDFEQRRLSSEAGKVAVSVRFGGDGCEGAKPIEVSVVNKSSSFVIGGGVKVVAEDTATGAKLWDGAGFQPHTYKTWLARNDVYRTCIAPPGGMPPTTQGYRLLVKEKWYEFK